MSHYNPSQTKLASLKTIRDPGRFSLCPVYDSVTAVDHAKLMPVWHCPHVDCGHYNPQRRSKDHKGLEIKRCGRLPGGVERGQGTHRTNFSYIERDNE